MSKVRVRIKSLLVSRPGKFDEKEILDMCGKKVFVKLKSGRGLEGVLRCIVDENGKLYATGIWDGKITYGFFLSGLESIEEENERQS